MTCLSSDHYLHLLDFTEIQKELESSKGRIWIRYFASYDGKFDDDNSSHIHIHEGTGKTGVLKRYHWSDSTRDRCT